MLTWQLTLGETVLRLGMAVLLGGMLGLEREAMRKAAGLRTHMMVSLGAAAFTLVTFEIFEAVMGMMDQTRSDPIRIVEGVIGGVGFLGAGTIIRSRGSLEGVTTASSIWVVGAVGLSCGAGYFHVAAIITGLAIVIISGIGRLQDRFFPDSRKKASPSRED
ncbi:MAG: MgtC/SapB family protein [Acidobacteriota bacterium]